MYLNIIITIPASFAGMENLWITFHIIELIQKSQPNHIHVAFLKPEREFGKIYVTWFHVRYM